MRSWRWLAPVLLPAAAGLGCRAPGVAGADDPAAVGRRAAAVVLARPLTPDYARVCAYYGVHRLAAALNDDSLHARIDAALVPFLTGGSQPRTGHVDHNVFGLVPLAAGRRTGDERLLALGRRLADDEWAEPRPDGLTRFARFWADDMYMVGSLQAQAFAALGSPEYADRGVRFLEEYCRRLQLPGGLFGHRAEWPFLWVRGNGWACASLTEMLLALPAGHPGRAGLLAAYRRAMAALVGCQEEGGLWPQLLDYPHVRPESSGTGMFVFALATGVREEWLPADPYREAANRGWRGLAGHVDAAGRVREVSHGTVARTLKPYLCNDRYPPGDDHGQAALLWAAAAVIRMRE